MDIKYVIVQFLVVIRDSSVGIATGCRLDVGGVVIRVALGANVSPFHAFQTGSGAHTTSYLTGTGGKAAGA
jgi:hypothetical protein